MELFSRKTFLILSLLSNLLGLGLSSSPSHQDNDDFLRCLTDQLDRSTDVIFTPTNASYASLLQPLNLRSASTSPQRPLLIITPRHESEIQAAIYCSKKVGAQIRIRGGGHDFEGLSYTSPIPFVIIDTRNLRSISIEKDEKTAWVQAGATLGQLYHAIARESRTLAFPAGVCPTVGVGGQFTGGGYGMMSRKHGLAADHVVDARLIDSDGRVLDRESMGEDLFWAIRGGGGTSFGIVAAFKVSLVTVPEIVTVFNVSRTLEQNATQVVHKWQYVADKMDDNLSMRIFLNRENSRIVASFTSLFLGRARDLVPLVQKEFPELGLVERDCIELSWIESELFFNNILNQPLDVLLERTVDSVYFKIKSDFVRRPIPVHGLEGMWRYLLELEDKNMVEVQFSPYGGALSTFSESETPFPHRSGNIFMIEYAVLWDKERESDRHLDWIRRLYSYMTPYVSKSPRAAYVNYRDLDIGANSDEGNTSYTRARVWGRRYFKNNFERLVRVKTRVDPSNFFRNEQSIPPMSRGRKRANELIIRSVISQLVD